MPSPNAGNSHGNPLSLAFFLIFLAGAAAASAREAPLPPAPTRWVTDTAGFLSESTRRDLDSKLEQYGKASKHQLIVWIGQSIGDTPIEDWAVKTFKAWGIGRKELNDGLVLFILAQDRKIRIEVGYGLEPVVPDVVASRIIREI